MAHLLRLLKSPRRFADSSDRDGIKPVLLHNEPLAARLVERLRTEESLPLASRMRVRLAVERATPDGLQACLRHALQQAAAPALMTPA